MNNTWKNNISKDLCHAERQREHPSNNEQLVTSLPDFVGTPPKGENFSIGCFYINFIVWVSVFSGPQTLHLPVDQLSLVQF